MQVLHLWIYLTMFTMFTLSSILPYNSIGKLLSLDSQKEYIFVKKIDKEDWISWHARI